MVDVPKGFSDFWTQIDPFFRPEHISECGLDGRRLAYFVPKLAPIVYFEEHCDGAVKRLYAGSVATINLASSSDGPANGGVWLQSYISGNMGRKVPLSDGDMLEGYVNVDEFFPIFDPTEHFMNVTADGKKMWERLKSLGVSCIDAHRKVYDAKTLGENVDAYNRIIRAENRIVSMPFVDMFPPVADASGKAVIETISRQ